MRIRFLFPLLLSLTVSGCCILGGRGGTEAAQTPSAMASPPSDSALAQSNGSEAVAQFVRKIDERFDDPRFENAFWGVLIQSLETGDVWYERNADKLFMPASNQKILTTAATLQEMGPDFRFTTVLCHTGAVKGDTIEGNLVVFGNGDPTLYEKFFKDSRDVFREWAGELKSKGITRITGDIVGDDNAFDDNHIGDGWPFDGLDAWYSAEFGALMLNEDYIDFTIVPPKTTESAVEIHPNLPSAYYTVVNNIQVEPGGSNSVRASRAYGTNEFVFRGRVGVGQNSLVLSPTISNPTLFYVTVLKEVLEQEGIAVEGRAVDCDDMPGWKAKAEELPQLVVHESPPLSEILTMLMKRSQNLYAETMVHLLGWKRDGVGSFRGGREVVRAQLAKFGVEPRSYQYTDGSGLTRYDLVSPRILVKVLSGMRESPNWEVWRDALPIAGVDGTLRNRMKGTAAEGEVRAKTGTISNVRGLSGYVTTADGEDMVFSFLVNAHLASNRATEEVTDDVCAMLASFTREAGK